MEWSTIISMLAVLSVLLFVFKRRDTLRFANGIIIGCFLLVMGLCYSFLRDAGVIGNKSAIIVENELAYKSASVFVLGQQIVKKHKSGNVLVFAGVRKATDQFTSASLKAIEESISGTALTLTVKYIAPAAATTDMMYQDETFITIDNYRALFATKGEYVAMISLVDVPYGEELDTLWALGSERFDIYLLLADIDTVARSVVAGHIDALVVWQSGVKFSRETSPSDQIEAFNKRYRIIDKSNIIEFSSPEALLPLPKDS